jgi:hypothetical protein
MQWFKLEVYKGRHPSTYFILLNYSFIQRLSIYIEVFQKILIFFMIIFQLVLR